MAAKPLLVCSGFFPDRHAGLVSVLSSRFDLKFLDTEGKLPQESRLSLVQHNPSQEEILGAAREYAAILDEATQVAGVREEPEERKAVLGCLLEQWVFGRAVRFSLQVLHGRNPVQGVLVVNDHLSPNRALVEEARLLGIPSFYVEHGFQLSGIEGRHFRMPSQKVLPDTDFIFVENALDVRYYEEFYALTGGRSPLALATGSPLDNKTVVPEALADPSGRDPSHCRILFCTSWAEANMLQWIMQYDLVEHAAYENFCRVVTGLRRDFPGRVFEVVVKIHPTLSKAIGVNPAAYYLETAQSFGWQPIVSDAPMSEWLPGADLQFSMIPSSVQWEAFLHGVASAVYLAPSWGNILSTPLPQVDSLMTRWGTQHFVWDGMDWDEVFRALLEKKWNGEIRSIRRRHFTEFKQTDPHAAAEAICKCILDPAARGKEGPATGQAKAKTMRILEIIHSFKPGNFRGTELYTLRMAKELQALGHEVDILHVIDDPNLPPFSFSGSAFQGLNFIAFNAMESMPPPRLEYYGERFDRAFREFLKDRDYDIFHFQHLLFMSPNWPAIARERGGKTVLKIDDMYFTCNRIHLDHSDGTACSGPDSLDKCRACLQGEGNAPTPKETALLYYHLAYRRDKLRHVYAGFDFVHSASRFLAGHFEKFAFRNRHVRHLATGIAPFEPLPRTRPSPGSLRIGYVGHIEARKGVWTFLQAAQRFRARPGGRDNLTFTIRGAVPNREVLQELESKLKEIPEVKYVGTFGQDDRASVFAGLDVLVAPSLGGNFPFLIREALCAGLPVISTNIAGIPEIIRPGVNGWLFPPGDAEALARIFSELSADPGLPGKLELPGFPVKFVSREAEELTGIFTALREGAPMRPEPAEEMPAAAARSGNLEVIVMIPPEKVDWPDYLRQLQESSGRTLSVTLIGPAGRAAAPPADWTGGFCVVDCGSDEEAGRALMRSFAEKAGGPVVLADTRMRMPPGWDEGLIGLLQGDVGAVGTVSDLAAGNQWMEFPPSGEVRAVETNWLGSLALCISGPLVSGLGLRPDEWEPRTFPMRLSMAMRRQGRKLLVATGVFARDRNAADSVGRHAGASAGRSA